MIISYTTTDQKIIDDHRNLLNDFDRIFISACHERHMTYSDMSRELLDSPQRKLLLTNIINSEALMVPTFTFNWN